IESGGRNQTVRRVSDEYLQAQYENWKLYYEKLGLPDADRDENLVKRARIILNDQDNPEFKPSLVAGDLFAPLVALIVARKTDGHWLICDTDLEDYVARLKILMAEGSARKGNLVAILQPSSADGGVTGELTNHDYRRALEVLYVIGRGLGFVSINNFGEEFRRVLTLTAVRQWGEDKNLFLSPVARMGKTEDAVPLQAALAQKRAELWQELEMPREFNNVQRMISIVREILHLRRALLAASLPAVMPANFRVRIDKKEKLHEKIRRAYAEIRTQGLRLIDASLERQREETGRADQIVEAERRFLNGVIQLKDMYRQEEYAVIAGFAQELIDEAGAEDRGPLVHFQSRVRQLAELKDSANWKDALGLARAQYEQGRQLRRDGNETGALSVFGQGAEMIGIAFDVMSEGGGVEHLLPAAREQADFYLLSAKLMHGIGESMSNMEYLFDSAMRAFTNPGEHAACDLEIADLLIAWGRPFVEIQPYLEHAQVTDASLAPQVAQRLRHAHGLRTRSESRQGKEVSEFQPARSELRRDDSTGMPHSNGGERYVPYVKANRMVDGVFSPVQQMRSEEDWGMIDFAQMRKVVDFKSRMGMRIYQILPMLCPKGFNSPYFAISSRLLDPRLISIEDMIADLVKGGILTPLQGRALTMQQQPEIERLRNMDQIDHHITQPYDAVLKIKMDILEFVWNEFMKKNTDSELYREFEAYRQANGDWLEDHLLYVELNNQHYAEDKAKGWDFREWSEKERERDPETIARLKARYAERIRFQEFVQFLAGRQYDRLVDYGRSKGVHIMEDSPLSPGEADVWIQPWVFGLKKENGFRRPETQGVAPDPFSDYGQYWQFFRYDFTHPDTKKFILDLMAFKFKRVSYLRLDHVLGFYRQYMWTEGALLLGELGLYEPLEAVRQKALRHEITETDAAWQGFGLFKQLLLNLRHLKRTGHMPDGVSGDLRPAYEKAIESLPDDALELVIDEQGNLKQDSMFNIFRAVGWDRLFGGKSEDFEKSIWKQEYVVESKRSEEYLPVAFAGKDLPKYIEKYFCHYLFPPDGSGPRPDDRLSFGFFRLCPGESLLSEIIAVAQERNSVILFELLGIVPPIIQASTDRLAGAFAYAPLVWGLHPDDTYHPRRLAPQSYLTLAIHDSLSIKDRWQDEYTVAQKKKILRIFFGNDYTQADVKYLTTKVREKLLEMVYTPWKFMDHPELHEFMAMAVPMWNDVLGLPGRNKRQTFRVNTPGQAMGWWGHRLPKSVSIENLIWALDYIEAQEDREKALEYVEKMKARGLRPDAKPPTKALKAVRLIRKMQKLRYERYELERYHHEAVGISGEIEHLGSEPDVGQPVMQLRAVDDRGNQERPFLVDEFTEGKPRNVFFVSRDSRGQEFRMPMKPYAEENGVVQWCLYWKSGAWGHYPFHFEYEMPSGNMVVNPKVGHLVGYSPWEDLNPVSPKYVLRDFVDKVLANGVARSETRVTAEQVAEILARKPDSYRKRFAAYRETPEIRLNRILGVLGGGVTSEELLRLFDKFPLLITYKPDQIKRKWKTIVDSRIPLKERLHALRLMLPVNTEIVEALVDIASEEKRRFATAQELRAVYDAVNQRVNQQKGAGRMTMSQRVRKDPEVLKTVVKPVIREVVKESLLALPTRSETRPHTPNGRVRRQRQIPEILRDAEFVSRILHDGDFPLTEREKIVVEGLYGLEQSGQKSPYELAEQLGCTVLKVNRIEDSAIMKLERFRRWDMALSAKADQILADMGIYEPARLRDIRKDELASRNLTKTMIREIELLLKHHGRELILPEAEADSISKTDLERYLIHVLKKLGIKKISQLRNIETAELTPFKLREGRRAMLKTFLNRHGFDLIVSPVREPPEDTDVVAASDLGTSAKRALRGLG
ncbi:MAG: 4-alpha-glucanotransferase, partial [Candidatus Omnitrophica bacterium]|nr:4-alpha-glucanotransferase [Candidatus Omnitrophota bacterium]